MKKQLIILASASILLTSCGKNSSEYKQLKKDYDSLQVVNNHYESDLKETDALIADVLTNFQEINSVESMINVSDRKGDMRRSETERLKDNIHLIKDKLSASSKAIDELNAKLKKSGKYNKRLSLTISALRKELEEKSTRIEELITTIKKKNSALLDLDNQVNSLYGNINKLQQAQAEKEAKLQAQEKAINNVSYCVGTSKDLKDFKVVQDGKVTTEKAESGYFTNVDKRKLSQIPLGETDKAKLLTLHPEGSYKLQKNADGTITLVIIDNNLFWKNSKVLVIEVE